MENTDYEKLRKIAFEARIEDTRAQLAKKGAMQDEIDDYIYSMRCIEELNDKYFAN